MAVIGAVTDKRNSMPVCVDRAVLPSYNDLATTDTHLLDEWDYEKNKDITPAAVSSIYAYEPNSTISKAYVDFTREVLADGRQKERLRSVNEKSR